MLKLTYTSTGVTLERSVESFEATIRRRVLLGLRIGEPVGLEPTSVSLLVDDSLPALKGLMGAVAAHQESAQTPTNVLELIQKGAAQVEMRLQGYWLAQQKNPGEGIFFMNADPVLEGYLVNIWQASHQDASCCS
ncbi:alr0857 family protein [Altericista sp. CCNU0014]|uniref:alr0857 family protein n=1 Tax=Altericista sp. CCNU0014 TaxID=3082949 RepID=UPI00384D2FE8